MSDRITAAEYRALIAKPAKGKRESRFGKDRRITTYLGKFDSRGEHDRYEFLLDCQRRGAISDLQRQVEFPFEHNGVLIGTYKADFVYTVVSSGQRVIEDYKGEKVEKNGSKKAFTTERFTLNKKLMRAFYGVEILVVTKSQYWNPCAVTRS